MPDGVEYKTITVSHNLGVLMAGTPDDAASAREWLIDEGGGTITLNTLQTINHDIIVRFSGNASGASITNNNLNGGGIELADQNAAAGTFTVSNNIFTYGPVNDPAVGAVLGSKTIIHFSIPHVIIPTLFINRRRNVSLENMNSITLDGNTFTPVANRQTSHLVVATTFKVDQSQLQRVVQVPKPAILTKNIYLIWNDRQEQL
ncbi:MAG: hypothetical protein IPH77_15810 [Ignavibacteria bacterium]|nr:hypothetical protein [Ignavibacteria bacterium]